MSHNGKYISMYDLDYLDRDLAVVWNYMCTRVLGTKYLNFELGFFLQVVVTGVMLSLSGLADKNTYTNDCYRDGRTKQTRRRFWRI